MRILGDPADLVELPDGTCAAAGDVVRLEDEPADALIGAGVAEDVSDVLAVRVLDAGAMSGLEPGAVVLIVPVPDRVFRSEADFDLAFIASVLRQFPDLEEELREALRESRSFGVYADMEIDASPQRHETLSLAEALALVDLDLAEIIPAAEVVELLLEETPAA